MSAVFVTAIVVDETSSCNVETLTMERLLYRPDVTHNLWSHRSLNHVHAALFQANGNEDMIEITPVSGYEKEFV